MMKFRFDTDHAVGLELGKFSEHDPVRVRLDPDHIEPLACGDAEMSALSHGEERDAVMFADDLSIGHDDLAGPERSGRMLFQKGAIIIVRHEADLLALGPLRGRKPELARERREPRSCAFRRAERARSFIWSCVRR